MIEKNCIAICRAAGYDLKRFKEVVGPLLPVLKDKNGRILKRVEKMNCVCCGLTSQRLPC